MDSLVRLTRTSEYRGLSKVEKAIKLMEEERCSFPRAARATGAAVATIFRAKKAREEGRPIGVPGRPLILGIDGEECLVMAIQEADDKRKQLSYVKLRERVCVHPSTFFLFFHPISPHNTHVISPH